MKTVAISFGEAFGVLFPIVDPLGNVPTFLAMTARWESRRRRALIGRVVLFFVIGLSIFALIGEPLLHLFGISLEALQIAGGIVIGFTGFQMITAAEQFVVEGAATGNIAFVPLTVPLLAGPGAMAALLALDSREGNLALSFPGTIAAIGAIGLCIYAAFAFGERITRRMGRPAWRR